MTTYVRGGRPPLHLPPRAPRSRDAVCVGTASVLVTGIARLVQQDARCWGRVTVGPVPPPQLPGP